MVELPKECVTPGDPPFMYVGIDCFGPLEVKQGRSHVKRYGCLFTCLTMRTLHIEIFHLLSAGSMINAIRRFISVQGCPKEIPSDNGTNFARADKELRNVTLFGKRGIKVNLENNVLTRLIGFVEKRGNAFCMRLNRFLMRLNNRLCCASILHFVCWKVS